MVFDIGAGLYWRLEEGGLLVRLERPGRGAGRGALDRLGLLRRDADAAGRAGAGHRAAWACAGSGSRRSTTRRTTCRSSGRPSTRTGAPIAGVTVASAGGHGMMWGPGVARVAADLAVHGRTDVVDVTDLGLDRFDADGRSRLAADPIALPFPVEPPDDGPEAASTGEAARGGRRWFVLRLAQMRVVRSGQEPRVVAMTVPGLGTWRFGRWPRRSSPRSRNGSASAGSTSTEPLSYKVYDPDRLVLGKRMEDHLRPGVCFWHSFAWAGVGHVRRRDARSAVARRLRRPDGRRPDQDGRGLRVLREDRDPVLLLPRPGRRARDAAASRSSVPPSMR